MYICYIYTNTFIYIYILIHIHIYTHTYRYTNTHMYVSFSFSLSHTQAPRLPAPLRAKKLNTHNAHTNTLTRAYTHSLSFSLLLFLTLIHIYTPVCVQEWQKVKKRSKRIGSNIEKWFKHVCMRVCAHFSSLLHTYRCAGYHYGCMKWCIHIYINMTYILSISQSLKGDWETLKEIFFFERL